MRRRMGAARWSWMQGRMAPGRCGGARPSPPGCPVEHWPEREDVRHSGRRPHRGTAAFDRYSGVDLVDAVAQHCQRLRCPPYRIGDTRYIDGGYRRNENADGNRIRTGAGAATVRGQITASGGVGMDLAHRSPNYAEAAAESKPSSRTAAPATHSGNMMDPSTPPPPLEPVTTKAELWPSSSRDSGAETPSAQSHRQVPARRQVPAQTRWLEAAAAAPRMVRPGTQRMTGRGSRRTHFALSTQRDRSGSMPTGPNR